MIKALLLMIALVLSGCNESVENQDSLTYSQRNSQATEIEQNVVNEADNENTTRKLESVIDTEINRGTTLELIEGVVMEFDRDGSRNFMMINEGFIDFSDSGHGGFGFRLDPDAWIAIDFTNAEIEVIEIVDGHEATPNVRRGGTSSDINIGQAVRIKIFENQLDTDIFIASSITIYRTETGLNPFE